MLVRRTTPATTAPPAGKGATVSYAAFAATTVGFALPQPEFELRNERASKLGQLDPRQRLNS
jgi:hypothetical protein